jgi:benzoate 4-monooxygenase
MTIVDLAFQYYLYLVATALLLIPVYHSLAWLWDQHGIRDIPGPHLAAFSDAWLGYWATQGCRSDRVHKAHSKHGRNYLHLFYIIEQLSRQVASNRPKPCFDR